MVAFAFPFLLSLSCMGTVPEPPQPDVTVVLRDVHVVDVVQGTVKRHQTVLVADKTILSVEAMTYGPLPEGAEVVDGRGELFVMPGLADMHVHIRADEPDWLGLYPQHGVTTVLNLSGDEAHLSLRDRVRVKTVFSPTIYTAGPLLQAPLVSNPAQGEAEVRRLAAAGFDVVKVYSDLDPESFQRVMEVAKEVGIGVVGHTPTGMSLTDIRASGLNAFAHTEEIAYAKFGRETAPDIGSVNAVAKELVAPDFWLIGTVQLGESIAEQWGHPEVVDQFMKKERVARWVPGAMALQWRLGNPYTWRAAEGQELLRSLSEFNKAMTRAVHNTGGVVLLGTDAGLPLMVPGDSLLREAELHGRMGFTNAEVLRSATVNPGLFVAQHLGSEDRFGQVEPGFRADLLLLDADPLQDLANLRKLNALVLRGELIEEYGLAITGATLGLGGAGGPRPPELLEIVPFLGTFHSKELGMDVRMTRREGFLVSVLPSGQQTVFERTGDDAFLGLGGGPTVEYSQDRKTMNVKTKGKGEFVMVRVTKDAD
jgi:hypothetical protein